MTTTSQNRHTREQSGHNRSFAVYYCGSYGRCVSDDLVVLCYSQLRNQRQTVNILQFRGCRDKSESDEGIYQFASPAGDRLPSNKPTDYITVVSGLPRSGTSMMMQMLAAGGMPFLSDNFRRADEDNPRGYYEYEAVKTTNQDASWLEHAYGKAVKMVYLLLYELPQDHNYRVVLMTRKISEVIASQETMLQRHSRDTGALSSAELGKVFENELSQLQTWLQDRPNFEVLKMNYNSVIRDPDGEVRRLVAFIDRNLNMNAMVAVLDRSLYRQRHQ